MSPTYFDSILAETVSTMARRLQEKHREAELPGLLDHLSAKFPETTTWILPDIPRLYDQVLELIHSPVGELSFNDGLLALACREPGIHALASFDRDFDNVPWLIQVAMPEDVEDILRSGQEVW